MLHSQHLFFRVGVISNVNELCHLWRIDLLKFPAGERHWLMPAIRVRHKMRVYAKPIPASGSLLAANTYEASSMAAVPTSCSFPLNTDIEDRKRSM